MITQNAQVESAPQIFIEDHGILTSFVQLNYGGGSRQGFGGYDLRYENRLHDWVESLMEVFGVRDLADIKGKPCRVKVEDGLVRSIGHFTGDRWFTPREFWA
jgi:hypothetical protein